jgi:hypothetical protein
MFVCLLLIIRHDTVAIAKGTGIQPDVENHQRQLHPNNPLTPVFGITFFSI